MAARKALADRFSFALTDRPDLGRVVGAAERNEPMHRVVPYKEAFSPGLVRTILDHLGVVDGALLDPFAGAGTSLLVAVERGLRAVGLDLLPFAAFASDTLLRAPSMDRERLQKFAEAVHATQRLDKGTFPDFPVRSWAFSPAALAELTRIRLAIESLPAGLEKDVLRLALLCVVEHVSQATKDGTSLRRRPHSDGRRGRFKTKWTRSQVQTAFDDQLAIIVSDSVGRPTAPKGSRAITGDARDLTSALGQRAQFDVAIFSPPYPNRYDYSANYQLELGFGFVDSREELKALRRAQLRSHLEAPWPERRTVESQALDEFLAALLAARRTGDQSGRVFKMAAGYFEDMREVFKGLASCMRPGAPVAIIIGTQVFASQELPTDLLLADIAESEGFGVKSVWIARRKGVAVQQRLRYGSVPGSRESVLLLEA